LDEKLIEFPELGHPRHAIEALYIGIHERIGPIILIVVDSILRNFAAISIKQLA